MSEPAVSDQHIPGTGKRTLLMVCGVEVYDDQDPRMVGENLARAFKEAAGDANGFLTMQDLLDQPVESLYKDISKDTNSRSLIKEDEDGGM